MKLFSLLKLKYRQFRRRQAAKQQQEPLREFVYLDEVSVYSLIASRLGPIAAEFTETQTKSLQNELGSSMGVTSGVAKADIKSKILTGETKGSQVLRKSIVQTTFKELYELEAHSFAIKRLDEAYELPNIPKNIEKFIASITNQEYEELVIDPHSLKRGQLFDVELQLEADSIFRVSTVISAFLEILEEDAGILGLDSSVDLVQLKSIGRILEKLLVGLVPIRGQAVDYSVVEYKQKEWIIHRNFLRQLPFKNLLQTRPLYIVGVAEQTLFWKDIRLLLFSNARYRVLCRLAQDSIQNSWTPVKLADVFSSVFPGPNGLDLSGLNALTSMVDTTKRDVNTGGKETLIRSALVGYAELLKNHYEIEIPLQAWSEISSIADQASLTFGSPTDRRQAFEAIAEYLLKNFKVERDNVLFAKYRSLSLSNSGLDLLGNPISSTNQAGLSSRREERFLDTEFVAIYW